MGKNKILVCVDGSDYTEPSLHHAAWLADRMGVQNLLVSHIADVSKYQVSFVNDLGAGIGLQPCNGLFSEIHKQEQDLLDELQERVKVSLMEVEWHGEFEFVVQRGRPAEALHLNQACRRFAAVVMGKRGDSFSSDKDQLGANLGKLLREVSVPCLMSSRQFFPIRDIALVMLAEQEWQAAVSFFSEYPLILKGLRVHLLHSFGDKFPVELEALKGQLVRNGVEFNVTSLDDPQDAVVAQRVQQTGAEMMVIGAHREASVLQWFTTPVAKAIIKACRIPILLCR